MIYTDLKEEHPELSLGTVYRNLRLLEELGKVRRVTNHQGNDRYDAICGNHAHFLCQGCGAITDLQGVDPETLRESLPLEEGYRPSRLDMIVTGRCPRCS
jgi:Fur family peroxide stress response transcriptional regulator